MANVQPVRMDAALDEITMPTEIVAAIGEGALAYRTSYRDAVPQLEFLADGYRVGSEWRLCLRRRHLPCNLQDSGAGGL